jgi:hypothetical protein
MKFVPQEPEFEGKAPDRHRARYALLLPARDSHKNVRVPRSALCLAFECHRDCVSVGIRHLMVAGCYELGIEFGLDAPQSTQHFIVGRAGANRFC